MNNATKRLIGVIWINLGIAVIVFESVYAWVTGKNGYLIVVWACGLAMLWQGIMMYRKAKQDDKNK